MLSVFTSKHYWMKSFLIYQIVRLWLQGSEKGIHRGRIFLEGVEKRAGKWLCGVKLLSNSIYPCMNILKIWIKVQNDWQRNQDRAIQMKTVWSWHLWESERVCGCVRVCAPVRVCACMLVCVWRRGLHALMQWPETTFIPAATTAALHTSHLQRLASIVETCTIFNWPSMHSGQHREESGLSPRKQSF